MKKFRTIREIIKYSEKKIKPNALKWLDGSAEYGYTTKNNREIFRKIKLIPQVLKDTKSLDLSKEFFGKKCSMPIVISPMGGTDQFHKKSEHIFFEASKKNEIPYFFPNNAGITLNELNPTKKKSLLSRSLYLDDDLDYCKKELDDLEKNNCHCVSITVDSPVRPISYNKMDQNYDERKNYAKSPLNYLRKKKGDPLTWKNISKIRKMTSKPIILKGILSKVDALKAYEHGINGIWVSNHGGRVFESDLTSLEVLSEIRASLPKEIVVVCDGGVRTGSDILKTLSLGADFVGVGRPFIFGLIANAFNGVNNVIDLLKSEFLTAMRLSGSKSFDDVKELEKILKF